MSSSVVVVGLLGLSPGSKLQFHRGDSSNQTFLIDSDDVFAIN